MSPKSYDAEDHGKILLIGHLDPAILIRVIASEYVRQPLGIHRAAGHQTLMQIAEQAHQVEPQGR